MKVNLNKGIAYPYSQNSGIMVERIKEVIGREGLIISIYTILFIIIVNSLLTFYYRQVIIENAKTKERVLAANHGIEFMNKFVNLADLGLRGFMIDQDEKFLTPYTEAIASYKANFDELEEVLIAQGFDVSAMEPAEKAVDIYMELVQQMVSMCEMGNVDEAVSILKADPGYDAWKIYSVFERTVLDFEGQISQQANTKYDTMITRMVVFQFLLFFISVPILIVTIKSIRKSRKIQGGLFKNLRENNKKYVYDSGDEAMDQKEESVISELISNLKNAAGFINNITQGNYDIEWEGMTKDNESLNANNIAGELITMRDQMKKVKGEDDIRIWTTQGLSNFAEIVRSNQNDFKVLSEKLIANIVKYMDAQQGGLFIVNNDNEDDKYLELMGCYAYDRAKSMDKRIEFGQSLVGQCYLEKETIYMSTVPQDFVNITSGLGDTRPDCILIVPLKLNDSVEGVIELASLKQFTTHEIEFIEKLGETIASAITTGRNTESTKILLEQSQQQAEEMRAQEEEMRQNMEELQATQEQMERKTTEVEELLNKTSENEKAIKSKNLLILEEKQALETETSILSTLMEMIPDRVTIKDQSGKYLKLSKSKYKSLKEQGFKNIIGKSDKDMFGDEHFEKSHSIEKEIMSGDKSVHDLKEKIEISKGVFIWGSTSRVPLKDKEGKILGTVVVTRDITRETDLEEELAEFKRQI